MNEKIYKTMGVSGVVAITTGVVVASVGIICGILSIIFGSRLLKKKAQIMF